MKPIRDEDLELAAAFVDGELSGDERTRFELRLSVEPELAAHVERSMSTDEFVRRHARTARGTSAHAFSATRDARASATARPRWRLLPALLAAAAAIVAIVGICALLRDEPKRALAAEVAIAESFESAAEWIARVPELAEQRPPGLDELRGEDEPANADPRAFVDAAQRAEARAFGASAAETTAAFFSIAVRITEPTQVVVFGFPTQGSPLRLWPMTDDERAATALLVAGDHVLPAPSFRLVEDPRGAHVEYRRGFLVPIGAERLEVVVATRAAGTALHADEIAPGLDAAQTVTQLRSRGFAVRTLVVREP